MVLQSVAKFVTHMPAAECYSDDGCTSIFLPGGLETAKVANPVLNVTLLEGRLFEQAETVQIANAPGYLLKYKTGMDVSEVQGYVDIVTEGFSLATAFFTSRH